MQGLSRYSNCSLLTSLASRSGQIEIDIVGALRTREEGMYMRTPCLLYSYGFLMCQGIEIDQVHLHLEMVQGQSEGDLFIYLQGGDR